MGKLTRFGISLEEHLLKQFDGLITRKGYNNRSEAIRDLIRDNLSQDIIQKNNKVIFGIISFVYDHHKREIDSQLNKIQHHFYKSVIFNTHVHIDHDSCLQMIVVKDKVTEIKSMSEKIISLKGVKQGKLSLISSLKNF